MTIIGNWPTFRFTFANTVSVNDNFAFVNSNPDTITKAAYDFAANGFVAGMTVDVTGSTSNNQRYTIATVAVGTLTLVATDAVTVEGPVVCDLLATHRDFDGVEEFPSEFGTTNLVRSGGFSGGISGLPPPWDVVSYVTVNSFTADAAPFVDEYNWYLSQRTDDPALQYLQLNLPLPTYGPPNTYSGTVSLYHTSFALTDLGVSGPSDFTMTIIRELYKNTALYCQRISDGSIQWVDIYRVMSGLV